MKITYICNSDFGKHGNIGFRTFQVAKETYKRGYLKEVIARGNKQDLIPKGYIKNIFPGYRLMNLGITGLSQIINNKKIYCCLYFLKLNIFDKVCKRKISKCDICHIYEGAKETIKRSHELGNITILDTQMPPASRLIRVYEPEKDSKIRERSIKEHYNLIKNIDYIVYPADFSADIYMKEYDVPKGKLIKMPCGVDLKKFKPKKHGKDTKNKKFICLFVGIINERKGVRYLLEAWEKLNLKNAELIVCGRIYADVENDIKKYKKNNTIKFMGFVDPVNEYQRADVFVFPSLWDNSAKVLHEAMASALPIITTFTSGPTFKNGTAGFIVPPKDPDAIAKKIKFLYNNPNKRVMMGKKARKIAETVSWDDYGKRMNDIYEKILKGVDFKYD